MTCAEDLSHGCECSQDLLDPSEDYHDPTATTHDITLFQKRTAYARGHKLVAAAIQSDCNMAAFYYDQSMALVDHTIGNVQQVDSIAIEPPTVDLWLLTSFLYLHRDIIGRAVHQT
jgi:hypothetical protein